jgi:prevent-host-death family protein
MNSWPVQDAKARFSELLTACLTHGPQMVTRRGQEAVVILAAHDFRRLSGHTVNLLDCLLHAPRGAELLTERSDEAIRDVGL